MPRASRGLAGSVVQVGEPASPGWLASHSEESWRAGPTTLKRGFEIAHQWRASTVARDNGNLASLGPCWSIVQLEPALCFDGSATRFGCLSCAGTDSAWSKLALWLCLVGVPSPTSETPHPGKPGMTNIGGGEEMTLRCPLPCALPLPLVGQVRDKRVKLAAHAEPLVPAWTLWAGAGERGGEGRERLWPMGRRLISLASAGQRSPATRGHPACGQSRCSQRGSLPRCARMHKFITLARACTNLRPLFTAVQSQAPCHH